MTDRLVVAGISVDLAREELRDRDGRSIELRPRSFSVLRRLATKAGELVTKDELLAACWPGVVVTEDSLTQCVSEIRRVLGEAGRDAIRTVPRRGYRLVLPRPAIGVRDRWSWPAIAVLPFDDIEGDTQALGTGFATDLVTELARNRTLTVIARQSSFAASRTAQTPMEIAALLGVGYVVAGNIRRAGDHLLVNVSLIDGADDRHVWAKRYAFSADEIYTVLDAVVSRIAGTLLTEIRENEQRVCLRRAPASLDAYQQTMQAAAHLVRFTRDGIIAAREAAERAVALDPGYGLAHVLHGGSVAIDASMAISGTLAPNSLADAVASIRLGIDLDPTIACGHGFLSLAMSVLGRYEEALMAAELATEHGPGDAINIAFLALAKTATGRYAEALATAERAIALNPLTPAYFQGVAAAPLYALDRFVEAGRYALASTARGAGYTTGYAIGAAADIALGRTGAAQARIAALLRVSPRFSQRMPRIVHMFGTDAAIAARFLAHLDDAGLPVQRRQPDGGGRVS